MIVKTIENDEKYLRQISKEVKKNDCQLKNDIEVLSNYCKENEVVAMAVIQLGIPKQIIYLKNTDLNNLLDTTIDEERILINPKIISRKGRTKYWEACASCMNNMGLVTRPYEIVVEYDNLDFNKQKITLKGFESTVFSHEYDHLNGILHIDIAEKILIMNQEERKEYRKTHGYEIISTEGDFQPEKTKQFKIN